MGKEGEEETSIALYMNHFGKEIAVKSDILLVATGRRLNVQKLGLEVAGVEYNEEQIIVDDFLRTTNPNIYSAGDCATANFRFTHIADVFARIVIRNALFFGRERVSALVPACCTYTM